MKYLKKLITQHINIEKQEWQELTSKFKKVVIKKGDIISNAGDIFSDFYFIKSGLARSYFTDLKGKDFTWQIYFRGKSKYAGSNPVIVFLVGAKWTFLLTPTLIGAIILVVVALFYINIDKKQHYPSYWF